MYTFKITFKITYLLYFLTLVGYVSISIFILSGVLFSPGTVGLFHDWPFGPYSEMINSWSTKGLYIWDPTDGNKAYPTDWLIRIIITPFSFLGGEAISKGLLSVLVILSGFSAFYLARQLKLSWFSSFIAGTFYIFSPIIFTRVIAGYTYYLIGYALSPFIVLSFLKGREENKNSYFIISGLLLAVATSQLQFFPMILLVLLIFSLIDYKNIKKNLRGLLIVFSVAFLIILLPVVLSQISVNVPSNLFFNPTQLLLYFTTTTASDLLESFRLLGYEGMPYSYLSLGTPRDYFFESNVGIIPPWIFLLDFLLPIVGFSSLLFRKDKYTISFAVISLIGLFLLKGTNPPFRDFFTLLFASGLYLFREVWHLAFLYGFSITFMASFFIEKLITYKSAYKTRSLFFKWLLPSVLTVTIIVANGYPLLTTNFAGYVQTYNLPTDYHTIYKNFSSSDNDYNVLVLPLFSPMRQIGLELDGLDPLLQNLDNQILPSNRIDRPLDIMATWLLSAMYENKTDGLGKLLSGLGIKYIVLRNDFVSNMVSYHSQAIYPDLREKWYRSLEPFLDRQKDLTLIEETSNYKIYENIYNATKVFIPKMKTTGLSDFNSLLFVSNLTSLSNVAVYPSNYSKNSSIDFLDTEEERQMPVNDFVEIGSYTNLTDPNNGWTNNRHWFGYRYTLDSRIHNGAFTTSNGATFSFELPLKKYVNKPVEIWIKALEWDKGGTVNTSISGKSTSLNLFSSDQRFGLYKVYEGTSTTPLHISIRNIDGGNYIEGIYIKEKQQQPSTIDNYDTNKTYIVGTGNEKKNYLIPNPSFIYWQKLYYWQGLPSYWNDTLNSCKNTFQCKLNFTDGWKDNLSFEISTTSNKNNTWSWIRSNEINVKPNQVYELVTHMKLNEFSSGSHIKTEGFNKTDEQWHQITPYCPATTAIAGRPLNWNMFSCEITIPNDISKIRLVLNGGWSSQKNQEAVTLFDSIYISKLSDKTHSENIIQKNILLNKLLQNEKATLRDYTRVNPTLYKVDANASDPFTLAFVQPYDPAWKATIYKNGKIVDTDYHPIPLYGVINAFEIKETGDLEVVLRYMRQDWFEIGLIISAITLAFCISFLFYDWKRRRLKQKVKGKQSHFYFMIGREED
jgi:hypothetical protein